MFELPTRHPEFFAFDLGVSQQETYHGVLLNGTKAKTEAYPDRPPYFVTSPNGARSLDRMVAPLGH